MEHNFQKKQCSLWLEFKWSTEFSVVILSELSKFKIVVLRQLMSLLLGHEQQAAYLVFA